ncbi:MAG: FixH family protein [Alphaproteobacteria bacterium]|nr:FixH family protein [Alphaproteobacteria bacterium]
MQHRANFELKGGHVLAILLSAFFGVTAVNVTMIVAAYESFPGEQAPKSYLQGLHYNDTLAARAEQAALGWRAVLDSARDDKGNVRLTLAMSGEGETPMDGLVVTGQLRRPATDLEDRKLEFVSAGKGLYTADLTEIGAGQWDLEAVAEDEGGRRFEFGKRLWLR